MRVVISRSAVADLEAIADWIAADNPERAAAFAALLRERCLQLGEMPRAFPLVPRYEPRGIRRRPVGDYFIFYRVADRVVVVLRGLHGARDYEAILFPD